MQRNLSAEKDARQNEKRRVRNRVVRSRAKGLVKNFVGLVDAKKKAEAQKLLIELSSFLDSAVTKGVYHRNTSARKKSRMAHLLSTLGS